MKKTTIAVITLLVLFSAAYYGFRDNRQKQRLQTALAQQTSENGFTQLPYDVFSDGIIILAAQNCGKKAAQDADNLAAALKQRGIPFQRTDTINSSIPVDKPDQEKLERLTVLINLPPPLVVINNKVRSNPDLEAVLAEYQQH